MVSLAVKNRELTECDCDSVCHARAMTRAGHFGMFEREHRDGLTGETGVGEMSLYYSNLLGRRVRGVKFLGIWIPVSRS